MMIFHLRRQLFLPKPTFFLNHQVQRVMGLKDWFKKLSASEKVNNAAASHKEQRHYFYYLNG